MGSFRAGPDFMGDALGLQVTGPGDCKPIHQAV